MTDVASCTSISASTTTASFKGQCSSSRRGVVISPLLAGIVGIFTTAVLPSSAPPALADEPQVLLVSPGDANAFPSINAALEAAGPGSTIRVAAGRYEERLVVKKPVSIVAYPEGADVEVTWTTEKPYQSTVQCSGIGMGPEDVVLLRGLRIRHHSEGVFDNYGVYINGGTPRFEMCDISSSSGTGVGVDGGYRFAYPTLVDCRIHSCQEHGVVMYGGMENETEGATLQGCEIEGNHQQGVLVRSGAQPKLLANNIHDNWGFGLSMQDCGGVYQNNTFEGNHSGGVQAMSVMIDLSKLRTENSIPEGGLMIR